MVSMDSIQTQVYECACSQSADSKMQVQVFNKRDERLLRTTLVCKSCEREIVAIAEKAGGLALMDYWGDWMTSSRYEIPPWLQ